MTDLINSSFIITSQTITKLKITIFVGVLLLVLWFIIEAFGGITAFPQNNETATQNSPVSLTENNVTLRDSIVKFSMELLDTPYVAAGNSSNGLDCSGFVYYVFKHFKIDVPRSSPQFANFGKEIPIDKVQKGDILVFSSPTTTSIGHIGIVTNPKGMETEFIHSTSGRQMKVVLSSLKTEGYKVRFLKAVSVIK